MLMINYLFFVEDMLIFLSLLSCNWKGESVGHWRLWSRIGGRDGGIKGIGVE